MLPETENPMPAWSIFIFFSVTKIRNLKISEQLQLFSHFAITNFVALSFPSTVDSSS
jgi:hypothetical protein